MLACFAALSLASHEVALNAFPALTCRKGQARKVTVYKPSGQIMAKDQEVFDLPFMPASEQMLDAYMQVCSIILKSRSARWQCCCCYGSQVYTAMTGILPDWTATNA